MEFLGISTTTAASGESKEDSSRQLRATKNAKPDDNPNYEEWAQPFPDWSPSNRNSIWPFPICKHNGWNIDNGLYYSFDRGRGIAECCLMKQTQIHNWFDWGESSQSNKKYLEAEKGYRAVVNLEPTSETDCMLRAFACVQLGILLSSLYHSSEKLRQDAERRLSKKDKVWKYLKDQLQPSDLERLEKLEKRLRLRSLYEKAKIVLGIYGQTLWLIFELAQFVVGILVDILVDILANILELYLWFVPPKEEETKEEEANELFDRPKKEKAIEEKAKEKGAANELFDLLPNDYESQHLFKIASETYQHPVGMFLYGLGLIRGTGGLEKDVPLGLKHLNKAAACYMPQAYFHLGFIYEVGLGKRIDPDFAIARDYYLAANQVIAIQEKKGRPGWLPYVASAEILLTRSETFHNISSLVVDKIGQRFAWTVAGQAFLFGATATIARAPQLYHFPPLYPILPILGLLVAVWSTIMVTDVNLERHALQLPVTQMIEAKIDAFETMASLFNNGDPSAYPILVKTKLSDLRVYLEKRRLLIASSAVFAILLNSAFTIAWVLLLVNDALSRNCGCSEWWDTTCTNPNVTCSTNDAEQSCELNDAPTLLPTTEPPVYECGDSLQDPVISCYNLEEEIPGSNSMRYWINIDNHRGFPDSMFDEAPNLPPCGENMQSSRTWVNIYDAATHRSIYGYCAFSSLLPRIWYAAPPDEVTSVYITLEDRACQQVYTSNTVPMNCGG